MKKLIFILRVLMMAGFANAKSIEVYYSKTGEQYGVDTITEGSGAAGTQGKLKKAEPNATVESVLAIRGITAQNNAATVKKTVSE